MLFKISSFWARVELFIAAVLAALITGLILLNVITRAMNYAIYWVDEAAIYAMAWMTFFAASSAIHHSQSVSVTLVKDFLKERHAFMLSRFVDVCVFIFATAMVYLCFKWFSPIEFAKSGFNPEIFQSNTFNFIYAEPTTTLGIKKAWVWLVMWLFSFGVLLHSVNNLINPRQNEQKI